MLALARNILRRFGFVCVLLLMAAAVVPTMAAEACEPQDQTTISLASAVDAPPQDSDDCGDCALACFHGCCHAAHAAAPALDAAPLALIRFQAPESWTHMLGVPPSAPPGLERPPRA